jgi:hypothetical protein
MEEFRDPNLDELYGPSRLNQPLPPNKVNWKQVGAYVCLTALAVGVPVVLVLVAAQKRQEKLLLENRKDEEKKRAASKEAPSDDEIVDEVCRNKQGSCKGVNRS